MRFYDREKELATLASTREIAFNKVSQMTVLTGRRRVGKTKLMLRSCEGTPTVYLFVSRNSENALCQQFSQIVRDSLDVFVPNGINSFRELFHYIQVFVYVLKPQLLQVLHRNQDLFLMH